MIARRLVFALVVAVLISGMFTFWISKKMARTHGASSSRLQYVATSHPMEAGEVFSSKDVQLIAWPGNVPLSGAFLKLEDVIGRTLLYPLANGEPILDRQLAAAGSGPGLPIKIPDGMRALSLKSDQVVGVAGFLLPGTHVDVLVTYHSPTSPGPITSIVLQDAQILAAGQKMQPDPDGKAVPVSVVTVLVTPQDAEKVVLASTQGTVHFVLRNGSDHGLVNDKPIQISSLGEIAAKPVFKPHVRMVAAIPAPKTHSVQVVQGDKQTVETFQ